MKVKKYITRWTVLASALMVAGLVIPYHSGHWGEWFVGALLYYGGMAFILITVMRGHNA